MNKSNNNIIILRDYDDDDDRVDNVRNESLNHVINGIVLLFSREKIRERTHFWLNRVEELNNTHTDAHIYIV